MGRFPQKAGTRGSLKWMQRLVNEKQEYLDEQIMEKLDLSENEEVTWLSPLLNDDYAEYRDKAFLDILDVELDDVPLEDFWPSMGPQWDGLAKTESGKLLLVEAKSHIPELISTCKAKNEKSVKKIKDALSETKKHLNIDQKIDWVTRFYQYSNKLAHLYLLRELNHLPAYLVSIYFVNDEEMKGPKSIEEWRGALELLHSYMGLRRHKLQRFMKEVFIDLKKISEG